MGIGPCSLQPGDLVVVILGLTVPLIVRKAQTAVEATYTLVGTCYVHGIMDGELVKARQEASQTAEMFDIVWKWSHIKSALSLYIICTIRRWLFWLFL
jgi:hypothetical protein